MALSSVVFWSGCDSEYTTHDQKHSSIVLREGECESLCGNNCCCFVELFANDNNATLQLCGTSNGASACLGGPNCGGTFSTGGQFITLTTMNPKELFCMLDGGYPMWIKNISTTDTAKIWFSCIYEDVDPYDLILDPGEVLYFETVSDCELDPCQ
jgi:hypothetical protein